MAVTHKAKMAGYHKNIWFRKRAITNIITLSKIIQKYRVTYDSKDKMFIVHQEAEYKPNMEFRIHKSGLHYYDPRIKKIHLLSLSLGTRKVTIRNKSRAHKLQGICTLSYDTHPGNTSSG